LWLAELSGRLQLRRTCQWKEGCAVTRVVVDFELCDSTGLCCALAPEIFELTNRDELRVHADAAEEADWQVLEEAARACPKLAISLRDGA
jgi:ferredoxin